MENQISAEMLEGWKIKLTSESWEKIIDLNDKTDLINLRWEEVDVIHGLLKKWLEEDNQTEELIEKTIIEEVDELEDEEPFNTSKIYKNIIIAVVIIVFACYVIYSNINSSQEQKELQVAKIELAITESKIYKANLVLWNLNKIRSEQLQLQKNNRIKTAESIELVKKIDEQIRVVNNNMVKLSTLK